MGEADAGIPRPHEPRWSELFHRNVVAPAGRLIDDGIESVRTGRNLTREAESEARRIQAELGNLSRRGDLAPRRPWVTNVVSGLVGLLLVAIGLGIGYWIWGRNSTPAQPAAATTVLTPDQKLSLDPALKAYFDAEVAKKTAEEQSRFAQLNRQISNSAIDGFVGELNVQLDELGVQHVKRKGQ